MGFLCRIKKNAQFLKIRLAFSIKIFLTNLTHQLVVHRYKVQLVQQL